MKVKSAVILFIAIVACSGISGGQTKGRENAAVTLERLFRLIRETQDVQKRNAVNDSIIRIIDSYSQSDTVFLHNFPGIRHLGQITSKDSLLKVITWNIAPGEGEGMYFCYLVRRDRRRSGGKVHRLTAKYSETPPSGDRIYNSSGWYGALYYDLRPFESNGITRYLILGIDYGNPFITRKVIDVLGFDEEGKLTLGMNTFTDEKSYRPRIIFEYSSAAVMSLRFESDKMVVFDHLSPFSPEYKDNRQFYGPDFSFDAYVLEKGMWILKSDIDIKNR